MSLSNSISVDAIYFDFSKAFDTIDYCVLVKKLAALSFPLEITKLILSFSTERNYTLKINQNVTNHSFSPASGVPQGSHLGPLAYLIYCNDIDKHIKGVDILLYADDTKFLKQITSSNDALILQQAINALASWSTENKLSINPAKTFHIKFSKREANNNYSYNILSSPIKTVSQHKDLGVLFDSKLNFHAHTQSVSMRAYQATGAIVRLLRDLHRPQLAIFLFKTYVWPIIQYGSVIWNQNYATYNHQLDRSLHAITRFALKSPFLPTSPGYLNFQQRLEALQLETNACRRLIHLYKTFFQIISGNLHSPFIYHQIHHHTNQSNVPTRNRLRFAMINALHQKSPAYLALQLSNLHNSLNIFDTPMDVIIPFFKRTYAYSE